MSEDNPRWNDQISSGLSVDFGNISSMYWLAKVRSVNSGELTSKEVEMDRFLAIRQFGTLAVAKGVLRVNDSVIDEIEVSVNGGYSPKEGEWISVSGNIILASEDNEKAFTENINQLKINIEKITGSEWNLIGDEINESGERRLPLLISFSRKDPDDPEDFPLIYIATQEAKMSEAEFIVESQRFQKIISRVVVHIYEN